jgi:hypothetical protein
MEEETHTIEVNLIGLSRWMHAHPRKNLNGFFNDEEGKPLTDAQVRKYTDWCVDNGYKYLHEAPTRKQLEQKGVIL